RWSSAMPSSRARKVTAGDPRPLIQATRTPASWIQRIAIPSWTSKLGRSSETPPAPIVMRPSVRTPSTSRASSFTRASREGSVSRSARASTGVCRLEPHVEEVLDVEQADGTALGVDHRDLVDAVLGEHALGFLDEAVFRDRLGILAHVLVDRRAHVEGAAV